MRGATSVASTPHCRMICRGSCSRWAIALERPSDGNRAAPGKRSVTNCANESWLAAEGLAEIVSTDTPSAFATFAIVVSLKTLFRTDSSLRRLDDGGAPLEGATPPAVANV